MRRVRVNGSQKGDALFHCWGVEFEEFDDGVGNYSVAIVEFSDGTVGRVPVIDITFIDEPEPKTELVQELCRLVSEMDKECDQLRARRREAVVLCQRYKDKLDELKAKEK